MAKVYTFLADGFETIEALSVVDLLRRAGIEVCTVSITDNKRVRTAQNIVIEADSSFFEQDYNDADVLFLPGGMPGTKNLEDFMPLILLLKKQNEAGKKIAAICAAPYILGKNNIVEGKAVTSYPGYEECMYGADYRTDAVVTDGNIITSRGVGTALDFGIQLITLLKDKETADRISKAILHS